MADLSPVKPIYYVFLSFYAVFPEWEWSSDSAISGHADSLFRLSHTGSNACELTSNFNTDAIAHCVWLRAADEGEKGCCREKQC